MKKVLIICFVLIKVNALYCAEGISNYDKSILFSDFNITSLMRASKEDDVEAVSILLRSGYNLNEKNIAGVSSLHICAKNNSINVFKELLKYSPDVNIRDNEGFTPLMRACMNNNNEIAKLLIRNNASMWTQNDFGESTLVLAAKLDNLECSVYILGFSILKEIRVTKYIEQQIEKTLNIAIAKQNQYLANVIDLYRKYRNDKTMFFESDLVQEYFKNDVDVKEKTVLILDAKKISKGEFKKIQKIMAE